MVATEPELAECALRAIEAATAPPGRDELVVELARLKDDYKTIVAQGHGYKVERDRLAELNAELRQRVVAVVGFCGQLERGLAADCERLTRELAVARGLLRDDLTDRNAARYEWLRDNVALSNSNNYGNATGLNPRDLRRVYRLEWHGPACNGDLDEIIDAASAPEARSDGAGAASLTTIPEQPSDGTDAKKQAFQSQP